MAIRALRTNEHPRRAANGDNIYPDGTAASQVPNEHHTQENAAHDTSVNRVLLGELFWYFGGASPELPPELVDKVVKHGRNHLHLREEDVIARVVRWVSDNYRIGVHGAPADAKRGVHAASDSDDAHRPNTC